MINRRGAGISSTGSAAMASLVGTSVKWPDVDEGFPEFGGGKWKAPPKTWPNLGANLPATCL